MARSQSHEVKPLATKLPTVSYVAERSSVRLKDMPAVLRPREEMDRRGVDAVSDDALLAVILGSGSAGMNVLDVARGLLLRYGSLTGMAGREAREFESVKGIGYVRARVIAAAMEIGRRLSRERMPARCSVKSPEDVVLLLGDAVKSAEHEMFWILLLDTKNNLKAEPFCVSKGILDASLAHPRELFKQAILWSAASVIMAHNHPSGDPAPSSEDIRITRQIVEAGRILDIKVLDHVVIGKAIVSGERDFISLREDGIVDFP